MEQQGRFDLTTLRDLLRMLPDLLHLLKRLTADPTLPRGVDAIIVAIALRSVIRHSGPDTINRHWPGIPGGPAAILRLAGTTDRH